MSATNRLADKEMVAELERQKMNLSYDEEVANGFTENDFNENEVLKYLSQTLEKKAKKQDLINLKLLINNWITY